MGDYKVMEFKETTTTTVPQKVTVKLPLEGCSVSLGKGCLLPPVLFLLIYILARIAYVISLPTFTL